MKECLNMNPQESKNFFDTYFEYVVNIRYSKKESSLKIILIQLLNKGLFVLATLGIYSISYAMGSACYNLKPLNWTHAEILKSLQTVYFKDSIDSFTHSTRFYPTERNGKNLYIAPIYYEKNKENGAFFVRDAVFEDTVLLLFSAHIGLHLRNYTRLRKHNNKSLPSDKHIANIVQFFIDEENFAYIVQNDTFIKELLDEFRPGKKLGSVEIKKMKNLSDINSLSFINWTEEKDVFFMYASIEIINLSVSNLPYRTAFVRSLYKSLVVGDIEYFSDAPYHNTILNNKRSEQNVAPVLSVIDQYVLCAKYSKDMPQGVFGKAYINALAKEITKLQNLNDY